MQELGLRWYEFDANYREYFKNLRDDQRLFDVTLATDDGQHTQAHKIILSAGSNFFDNIFVKSNHDNMLIYLRGIDSIQLEYVTDFIYNGEIFIAEEELKQFLQTARELQVKGLMGELQRVKENDHDEQITSKHNQFSENTDDEQNIFTDMENRSKQNGEGVKDDASNLEEYNPECIMEGDVSNDGLDHQIEEMIEKKEGVWKRFNLWKGCMNLISLKELH